MSDRAPNPDPDASKLLYSARILTLSAAMFAVAGVIWLVSGQAAVIGVLFLGLALALYRDTTPARAKSVFSFSLSYLAILFVAMAIDPIVLA